MRAYISILDIFLEIIGDNDCIEQITYVNERGKDDYSPGSEVEKCLIQLQEFFAGERREFSLNLAYVESLTDFTRDVYQALQEVPYGTVASYQDIAIKVGRPKAYRAVGNANNRNKFAVVIPCHRILGSNYQLVGYAPGLKYKEYLLDLEREEEN